MMTAGKRESAKVRLLVIGAGVAGLSACRAIREVDGEVPVTLVSDEKDPFYSRPLLCRAFDPSRPPGAYAFLDEDRTKELGIRFIPGKKVIAGTPGSSDAVVLDDGSEVPFTSLLIATGGSPVIPQIPGAALDGICGLRNLRDVERIGSRLSPGEEVLVLGGGNVGLQAAEVLHGLGASVTVLVRSPFLLSQAGDERSGEIYRRLFRERGIDVMTGVAEKRFIGRRSVAYLECLDDEGRTRKLPARVVVVGKGVRPDFSLAKSLGIETKWGIVVDDRMATNRKGVFAAGDVAETVDLGTGERTVNALWPCAGEQGTVAGLNMAGRDVRYAGSLRMNAIEFFGLSMISMGRVRESEEDEVLEFADEGNDPPLYRKIVLNRNRVKGVILLGDIGQAGVYHSLIAGQFDVTPLRPRLLGSAITHGDLLSYLVRCGGATGRGEFEELVKIHRFCRGIAGMG